jgi:C-terminal processing protease CtpA/Prc
MRLVLTFALVVALLFAGSARAEDLPEGSIGVKVELKDEKIVVKELVKGGPGEKAGLKVGDQVVRVNDYLVKNTVDQFELERAVREIVKHKPGDKIKLEVVRGGKDMMVEVTVGKRSEIFPKPKD